MMGILIKKGEKNLYILWRIIAAKSNFFLILGTCDRGLLGIKFK